MTDEAKIAITENDLLAFHEDKWIEVVDGELIESDMSAASFMHVIVIDNLYNLLRPIVKRQKLGRVHTDGLTFVLRTNPDGSVHTSRIPDLFFLRNQSIPEGYDFSRTFHGAPDLAVEVTSPGESKSETIRKMSDYFDAGTDEVWIINPQQQTLEQHLNAIEETARVYYATSVFEPNMLFPGLKITISDLFVIDEEE
jgi:Uma2 family endonuclease